MYSRYRVKFDEIESEKSKWIDKIGALNPEDQAAQKDGKWSVIQHGYHLYLAEKGSLAYVKKKLSFNPKLDKAGIKTYFRGISLWFFMKAPFKFKAPEAVGETHFPVDLTLKMLDDIWNQSRSELQSFLEEVGEKYVGLELYKQPFAGRITLEGMLRFFQLHQERHFKHTRDQLGK